jgi:sugar/nucleoside kinase (ribokinase family)
VSRVVAIGEIIVDFVSTEPVSYTEARMFEKCFGGAPMNTAVGVSRLGVSAGVVTAVGADPFGDFLVEVLRQNEVDVTNVKRKEGRRTTIAFVANEPITGERTFLFYRKPWTGETADSSLERQDVDPNYISRAEVLHVSGFALSQQPSRRAILHAIGIAQKSDVLVSFDPTLRSDVWNNEESLRRTYRKALELSDIATFSREEAEFVLGTKEPDKAASKALKLGPRTVGIKLGAQGSFVKTAGGEVIMKPAFSVKPIDATGAGDGWNAGFLIGICEGWDLEKSVTVANAVGALVVTKRGAITAMPYRTELDTFLRQAGVYLSI